MNDSEALTLQAFLAALIKQQEPLSDEAQAQLEEIAQSLETRVMELHDLALSTTTLAESYQNARDQLISTAAERGLGLEFLPNRFDNTEENNNRDIDNILRIDFRRATRILSAPDSVQAARQAFN